MHAGHHRRVPLHVDVIHFSLLLGHLQSILNDAIIMSSTLSPPQKAPLVKAWGKLFWIQSDLFTKWHVRDGDDYDQTSVRATKLDVDTSFAGMWDDEGKAVHCPFSAVAKLEPNPSGTQGYVYKSNAGNRLSYTRERIGSINMISLP
jgi:hypothetical protein